METELLSFNFEVVAVNKKGKIVKRERKKNLYYIEKLNQEINLEMAAIPGETFLMGSLDNEEGFLCSQTPRHWVMVRPFWISKYPITQAQWQVISKSPQVNLFLDSQPSNFSGKNRPVEQVSWYEAKEFCARLSQLTERSYYLPSEVQWEYACRGTLSYPFHFGETITTDLANYSGVNWEYNGKICSRGFYGYGPLGEDRRETTNVGFFQVANHFGLYDLHGNVREWCEDIWHPNYIGAPTNSQAWITGGDETKRIVRGGSWNGSPHKCRSAYRGKFDPNASLYDIGFRVVYY
ncbi:MAG TPA: formylglycine-generating enzyme family protein [Cyanothece sp. UBA12306]|nr:formylglycine-generating enzyme family protein [Cyanothece sp. UBA12306]